MTISKKVLFLCTGNYYRSRFAEELFNDLARRADLNWVADSRALNITAGRNVGPMSPYAMEALRQRGIELPPTLRFPVQVCDDDLAASALIIALKELEHRPLVESLHPRWARQVEYWHVHDLDKATAEVALAEIERLVGSLIDRLRLADHAVKPIMPNAIPSSSPRRG